MDIIEFIETYSNIKLDLHQKKLLKRMEKKEKYFMKLIAKMDGYFLYYDEKYDDYIVVTPNYKISRYYKRLNSTIAEYFDEKYNEFLKEKGK